MVHVTRLFLLSSPSRTNSSCSRLFLFVFFLTFSSTKPAPMFQSKSRPILGRGFGLVASDSCSDARWFYHPTVYQHFFFTFFSQTHFIQPVHSRRTLLPAVPLLPFCPWPIQGFGFIIFFHFDSIPAAEIPASTFDGCWVVLPRINNRAAAHPHPVSHSHIMNATV